MKSRRWHIILFSMCVALIVAASGVSAEVLTLEQCIDIALEKNGSADFRLPQTRLSYHQAQQNVWSSANTVAQLWLLLSETARGLDFRPNHW